MRYMLPSGRRINRKNCPKRATEMDPSETVPYADQKKGDATWKLPRHLPSPPLPSPANRQILMDDTGRLLTCQSAKPELGARILRYESNGPVRSA